MSECEWCAYLRSIGATKEYIESEHHIAELEAECERLRAALVTAKTELARWGWGDDHYLGHAKQDRSIEGTVAIIDAALAAPPDQPTTVHTRHAMTADGQTFCVVDPPDPEEPSE